jgi:hypothetical protein
VIIDSELTFLYETGICFLAPVRFEELTCELRKAHLFVVAYGCFESTDRQWSLPGGVFEIDVESTGSHINLSYWGLATHAIFGARL